MGAAAFEGIGVAQASSGFLGFFTRLTRTSSGAQISSTPPVEPTSTECQPTLLEDDGAFSHDVSDPAGFDPPGATDSKD
jgi:hypothetical protein